MATCRKPFKLVIAVLSNKVQETQEALIDDGGFLLRVYPRERRYAELGYLLPFYLRLAVKTRCVGPSSWHALYVHPTTVRTFGYAPVGHSAEGAMPA